MDRKKAEDLLKVFGHPVVDAGKTKLVFARQDMADVERIESMSLDELVNEWKGLTYVNHIYGCVSLNELQRIGLIDLELEARGGETVLKDYKLREWYDAAKAAQDAQNAKDEAKWKAEQDAEKFERDFFKLDAILNKKKR